MLFTEETQSTVTDEPAGISPTQVSCTVFPEAFFPYTITLLNTPLRKGSSFPKDATLLFINLMAGVSGHSSVQDVKTKSTSAIKKYGFIPANFEG